MNKLDHNFTEKLRVWLNDEHRDPADGAMLLFRLRANPVEYRKLSAAPHKWAEYIFNNIKKFYEFRTSAISHEEVSKKVVHAVHIAENVKVAEQNEEKRTGKRADHDSLPEEIQACYNDNIQLMKRIADTHTKIRLVLQSNASCKDADLLPLAQHIIKLDKERLANWKKYDEFTAQ